MSQLRYDKTTSKTVSGKRINYGIVFGNEKIVFMKTGADGNIRGYKGKNLQMAHRVNKRLGATVICASNPDIVDGHLAADQAMIAKVAQEEAHADYCVLLLGTSDGAYHNLRLAKQIPQVVRFLGINASLIGYADFAEKLQEISCVKKLLVYGTKDEAYKYVPALKELACDNLEIMTIEGVDHGFTGMLEEYIALIDLL